MNVPNANHVLYTGHLSFLEASMVEYVRGRKANDPLGELWVIVPNQLTRLHLRRLLARRLDIVANIRFMTVTDLMHVLAEPVVLQEGWKTLGESVVDPLFAEIIAKHKDRLKYLAPVADSAGFRRALLRVRQELIYHRIQPDALMRVQVSGQERAAKISDLVLLLNAIASKLDKLKLHDAAKLQTLAFQALSQAPPLDLPVCFYALYELDPLTLSVIEKLRHADDMSVFLPCVPESKAYDLTSPLRMWYLDRGFEEVFEESPAAQYRPVRVVSAPHDTAVAAEIVRDVFHDARVQKGEAVVLLPNSTMALTDVLESRCRSAGLTPYIYQARTLAETPAGRGFGALAKMLNAEFSLGQVKAFLASAPFVESIAPLAGGWIRFAEESLIIAGEDEWRHRTDQKLAQLARRLERRAEELDPDDLSLSVLRRQIASGTALQDFTRNLFETIHAARNASGWEEGVRTLWEYYTGTIVLSEEFADLTLQLDQASLLDSSDTPFSSSGLQEFILATLETPGQRIGSFANGTPVVSPREQSVGVSFPHVFLPGFNEGTLPHAQRQDPLLLDGDREAINRELGTELPLAQNWQNRERFLLEMQLRAATESISIYASRADAEGRPQLLSPYVSDLLEIQRDESPLSLPLEKIIEHAPNRIVPAHPLESSSPDRALSRSEYHRFALGTALKTSGSVLSYLMEEELFRAAIELESSRFRSSRFTKFDGRIENPRVLEQIAANFDPASAVDASTLENYWKCPFRFVATREWEAYSPEEQNPLNPLTALDRGTLLHNILQSYHGAQTGKPITSEHYTWDALHKTALAEIDKFSRRTPLGPKYAVDKLKRDVLSLLTLYYEYEIDHGSWRTRFVEARFGFGDGAYPDPVQFESHDSRFIRFRGRVDRWDSDDSGTRIRITDYKTGSEPKEKSRAYSRRLQLAIYHHVVKKYLKDASVDARYFYLKSGTDSEQADEVSRQRELEECVNLLSDMRAGIFVPDPSPDDSAVCMNCSVKLACGAQRHAGKQLTEGNVSGLKTTRSTSEDESEDGNE